MIGRAVSRAGVNVIIKLLGLREGIVLREVRVVGSVRLSEVVNELLRSLGINLTHRDLEPYYVVVVNGDVVDELMSWDDVVVDDDDEVVIMRLAFGG